MTRDDLSCLLSLLGTATSGPDFSWLSSYGLFLVLGAVIYYLVIATISRNLGIARDGLA
jgi:hypothetical protein